MILPYRFLLLSVLIAQTAAVGAQKKLIYTGWDSPTPAQFKTNLTAFEKYPFDGTTVQTTRKLANGKEVDSKNAFINERWNSSEFESTIADLKAAHPRTAKDNFLILNANPGNVDWFDDSGWKEIVNHWRLLARTAKQGGLRGILFDAEPYTPPFEQFSYGKQSGSSRWSFTLYSSKARQRGREVMRAIAAEYPDITIYSYRLFCDILPSSGGDAQQILPVHSYGLLPAFVNGWLDAAAPGVTIIEGDENAYSYNSVAQFDRAYTRLKTETLLLIAPENRVKFKAQYQISHGIYLDAHSNPPTSPWYIDPLGGTSGARLKANVSAALRSADEYVWVYGETARWWQNGNPAYPLWSDKISGADTAIRLAKDPVSAARERLKNYKQADNLLLNPGFDNAKGEQPAEWWFWQDEKSYGKYLRVDDMGVTAKGAACINGAENACFGQDLKVSPGKDYAVSMKARQTGNGAASMTIRWRDAAGKWTATDEDVVIIQSSIKTSSPWREWIGVVHVPAGAATMVVLVGVQGQKSEQDKVWFDDVAVVTIEN